MKKYGKKYKNAAGLVKGKVVSSLSEAAKLIKETGATKFDSTAEIHFNLSIDPKQADQAVRTTVVLPHGTGKKLKIAAVVPDGKVSIAKAAGAAAAGLEDLIAEFESGKFDYDVVVATPDVMKHLGKVAKNLGQKGLMPNPKSGTVTTNIEKTIEELSRGRIELRNDKEGNVHSVFGKVSFKQDELENNLRTLLQTLRENKPSGIKGTYINSITICTTMGPSIKLDVNEVMGSLLK
ncbi:50S ribosomal protein L1 [Candidatus Peregrinibacteria bacterium]|nr:50S ribosomal protein L1 [Candidatus Peregrinibacteria bacterium]